MLELHLRHGIPVSVAQDTYKTKRQKTYVIAVVALKVSSFVALLTTVVISYLAS
jgi:hypothetical protein